MAVEVSGNGAPAAERRRLSGEHDAIAAAIRDRDAEAAERAMDLHVAASELSVRALLTAIRRRLGS